MKPISRQDPEARGPWVGIPYIFFSPPGRKVKKPLAMPFGTRNMEHPGDPGAGCRHRRPKPLRYLVWEFLTHLKRPF